MSSDEQMEAGVSLEPEDSLGETQPKQRRRTTKKQPLEPMITKLKAPSYVTPKVGVRLALRDTPSLRGSILRFISGSMRTMPQNIIQITAETLDNDGNVWGHADNRGGWIQLDFTKKVG